MSTILTREQLKQMVKNPHIDHWYESRCLATVVSDTKEYI